MSSDSLPNIALDAAKYRALHTPEIADFIAAVEREAIFQREKWGADGDDGKVDTDWFWLIGYLAGKAIRPGASLDKRLHHIITTAAACLNWHAARVGTYTTMRPGIAEPASPKLLSDASAAADPEARADSAVPSSHVSGTDEPKASKESILREALARLLEADDELEKSWDDTRVRMFYGHEHAEQWRKAREAARSALAGMPLNASGDPTERSG